MVATVQENGVVEAAEAKSAWPAVVDDPVQDEARSCGLRLGVGVCSGAVARREGPLKVLLVTADEALVWRLQASVARAQPAPLEIASCPGLAQAWESLRDGDRPDVLLLDLTGQDGQALADFMTRLAGRGGLPVVILAESEAAAVAQELAGQGAQACLVKADCSGGVVVRVLRYAAERGRIVAALRANEQRYKRLLTSTTDYIYTVRLHADGTASTEHGPACITLTGYRAEEFAADPHLWLRMVPESDRPAVLEQIQRILQGDRPAPLEHRIIHKDGRLRWIRNTCIPHTDPQGRLMAYDGLISDITERKQAEEQLTQANAELARSSATLKVALADLEASHEALKATQLQLVQAAKMESVGTLAAGVAHEVKNPLQTILMGLSYVANNLPPDQPALQTALDDMREAVTRADRIIRELLQISAATQIRLEAGDFNALVTRSLWLVHYELLASKVSVVQQLGEDLPPVRFDPHKMGQALINLFLNALQAMPGGGTLSLRTRTEVWAAPPATSPLAGSPFQAGDRVLVAEIQDTGEGIAEEDLPRLFDPFFTTKPAGKGTGLGLSIVKQIVDLHGGIIRLENAAEGGARVTLVLKS
jgi:PAS domain S-box-containing protein